MFKQVAILAVLAASIGAQTPYTDCGSTATIHGFLGGVCTQFPCMCVVGYYPTIAINMTSNSATPEIDVTMSFRDNSTGEENTFLYDLACDDLVVGDCPIEVGEELSFAKEMYIDPAWVGKTYDITYEIHEYDNKTGVQGEALSCFIVVATFILP